MRTTLLTGVCCFWIGVSFAQQERVTCDPDAVFVSIGGIVDLKAGRPEKVEDAYRSFRTCPNSTTEASMRRWLHQLGVAYLLASEPFDRSEYELLLAEARTWEDRYAEAALVFAGTLRMKGGDARMEGYETAWDLIQGSDSAVSTLAARLAGNVAKYRYKANIDGEWQGPLFQAVAISLSMGDVAQAVHHMLVRAQYLARDHAGSAAQERACGMAKALLDTAYVIAERHGTLELPQVLESMATVANYCGTEAERDRFYRQAADLCLDQLGQGRISRSCVSCIVNYLYMGPFQTGQLSAVPRYLNGLERTLQIHPGGHEACLNLLLNARYAEAMGHFSEASVYLQWADTCFTSLNGAQHAQRVNIDDLQIKLLDRTGHVDKALALTRELAAAERARGNVGEWNKRWANMAITYRNNGQYEAALALHRSDSLEFEANFINVSERGIVELLAGDPDAAAEYLNEALTLATAKEQRAMVRGWIARTALAQGDPDGADRALMEAYAELYTNPAMGSELKSSRGALDHLNLVTDDLQRIQVRSLLQRFRATKDPEVIASASMLIDSIQDRLDLLSRVDIDERELQPRFAELLELRLAIRDFGSASGSERKEQLLRSMESMRSRALRTYLLHNEFARERGASVYDSLRSAIRARIKASSENVLDAQDLDGEQLSLALARLNGHEQQILAGTGSVRTAGTGPWKDIDRLEDWSREHQVTVLNYMHAPGRLLCLMVDPEGSSEFEFPIASPQLRDLVDKVLDGSERSEDLEASAELSALILPKPIRNGRGNLLMLTDGALDRIPFELLVMENGDRLIDHWQIRYAYALELACNSGPGGPTGPMIGLAPTYKDTIVHPGSSRSSKWLFTRSAAARSACTELKENAPEALACAERSGGKALVDREATEKAFREAASSAGIIHLAGHGFILMDEPLLSGLVFSTVYDSTATHATTFDPEFFQDDGVLHAFEIRELDLPAELVVLSACHTGTGARQEGEGTLSLARAFMAAGARNVVMSLWKVDDLATKQIMVKFYEYLAEGLGKADALAEAKRWYRGEFPNEPPSKWAAFILVGDNEPVQLQKRSTAWPWMIGAGGLLLFAGYSWSRRRTRKAA